MQRYIKARNCISTKMNLLLLHAFVSSSSRSTSSSSCHHYLRPTHRLRVPNHPHIRQNSRRNSVRLRLANDPFYGLTGKNVQLDLEFALINNCLQNIQTTSPFHFHVLTFNLHRLQMMEILQFLVLMPRSQHPMTVQREIMMGWILVLIYRP